MKIQTPTHIMNEHEQQEKTPYFDTLEDMRTIVRDNPELDNGYRDFIRRLEDLRDTNLA